MSINQVLVAVLPVAAPFLAALYQFFVSRLPANRAAFLKQMVGSSVVAAEKVYQDIPGSGQAKRQYVVSRIEAVFGKRINPALLEVLLEEAVTYLPPASTKSAAPSAPASPLV